ncbi:MAG: Nif3-like dinuclear metal center hexameric protein [Lachnospiraceae bacterium]|nr:Nif3-like dinuclear metal center hexameric protein [Lachnospiraceae bacterium]
MKINELIKDLEILAPPALALPWDNPGLLVGDGEREVTKVFLALDAGSGAIGQAAENGCGMIITHHPMIFSAIKEVRADDPLGKRIIKLIRNDMACYAMHTNYDAAVMAWIVADRMGLPRGIPLETEAEHEGTGLGIGFISELAPEKQMTLRELAASVKEKFGLPEARFYGEAERPVRRIACCPGSGKGMDGPALAGGAEVLVTGDVDHHYALDCLEEGLAVIDAGHHGLEHIFTEHMRGWFAEKHPEITVFTLEEKSPFSVV